MYHDDDFAVDCVQVMTDRDVFRFLIWTIVAGCVAGIIAIAVWTLA